MKLLGWAEETVTEVLLDEIRSQKELSMTFRMDSRATKMWSGFAKVVGEKYLELFLPLFRKLYKKSSSAEVPTGKKLLNVVELVGHYLSTTYENLSKLHSSLRQVLRAVSLEIYTRCQKQEQVQETISTLFFLRFLVPAISQPDSYLDVKAELNQQSRKIFINIARVIQNLSVGLKFDPTDPLAFCNPFIKENYPLMIDFLNKLSGDRPPSPSLSRFVIETTKEKEKETTTTTHNFNNYTSSSSSSVFLSPTSPHLRKPGTSYRHVKDTPFLLKKTSSCGTGEDNVESSPDSPGSNMLSASASDSSVAFNFLHLRDQSFPQFQFQSEAV